MRILVAVPVAVTLLAGCSHPSPPPVSQTKVARTPVSATPTCADMGPLLRGRMDDEETRGPAKEAAIIEACTRDAWAADMLACVARANEPQTTDCLGKLTEAQRAHYAEAVAPFAPEAEGEEATLNGADDWIGCDEAFASSAFDAWPPAVTSEAERAVASKLRGAPVRALCDSDHWEQATVTCFAHTPASALDGCLGQLGASRRAAVDKAIADADALRAKLVKVAPAAAACDKVATARYAPAKWTGKAPALRGAARTQAIARSRQALRDACTSRAWPVELRQCLVADGRDECFALGAESAVSWGYPASTTGMAACDDYARGIEAIASCGTLPEESRKAIKDAYDQAAAAWASVPEAGRPAMETACRAAADAVQQLLQQCT